MKLKIANKLAAIVAVLYLGLFLFVWAKPKLPSLQWPDRPAVTVPDRPPTTPTNPIPPIRTPPSTQQSQLDGSSWAYYLKNPNLQAINTSLVKTIIMDMDVRRTPIGSADIAKIKQNNKTAIAYISAGEAEEYRGYWSQLQGKPDWIGPQNPLWRGSYVVTDLMNVQWLGIVKAQVDLAINTGYDGMMLAGLSQYRDKSDERTKTNIANLIEALSQYAKQKRPGFIVVAQDVEFLADNSRMVNAIDGVIKQDLIYSWKANGDSGPKNPPDQVARSIEQLRTLKNAGKTVLVVEYVGGDAYQSAKQQLQAEGFFPYSAPRELNAIRINQ